MINIFREYDIRGIFEKELNQETVKKIGYFFAKKVKETTPLAKYISIGYDARSHSPLLCDWLVSGINSGGMEVLFLGIVPTPTNYFSNFIEFDGKSSSASIMITGSHNPPEYNGFKLTINKEPFFGKDIYALGEQIINSNINASEIVDNNKVIPVNGKQQYINYMIENFKHLNLKGEKFVFDCGNGVAGIVLRDILEGLNINSKIMFEQPDGTFPNHHPDPGVEANLVDIKKELQSNDYALGFAYDGDADRIGVLSNKYIFKGDILAIFLSKFIENPIVIGEVKCSQNMYDIINTYGTAIMHKTGHSNLKVKIKETNASLATEVSGHMFFNDRYFGFDDAIYSTLRVLELVHNDFDFNKNFEELPQTFATNEENIKTADNIKFEIVERVKQKLQNPPKDFPTIKDIIDIDGVRVNFENGWGLVRASNTSPNIVTRFEAIDEKTALFYKSKILDLITTIS